MEQPEVLAVGTQYQCTSCASLYAQPVYAQRCSNRHFLLEESKKLDGTTIYVKPKSYGYPIKIEFTKNGRLKIIAPGSRTNNIRDNYTLHSSGALDELFSFESTDELKFEFLTLRVKHLNNIAAAQKAKLEAEKAAFKVVQTDLKEEQTELKKLKAEMKEKSVGVRRSS